MLGMPEPIMDPAPPYSAFRTETDVYSFTKMTIFNSTHVLIEEFDADYVSLNKLVCFEDNFDIQFIL